ncbi:hypothetical protein RUM43_009630 [Polyplax serrata]|uniref:Ig-like domain-containing protein n=1 Tax=Polyplax serrata TaxID=468196 RepID=A0AAN8P329_POLSC
MKGSTTKKGFLLVALFVSLTVVPACAGSCPSVCSCKWKGGKQTVECVERALITVPENIDGETQVLDMSGNNLQIIPTETFYKANLTNLQKVYLRSCKIGQIGERAFRGLTNLIEIDLSHNLLTAVPSGTFEDTPFLRYLSLNNNPIQKIESNAFGTVLGVAKIDLSHCEIQNISPKAFDKVESLEWLKLNGNKLTELDPETVDSLSRLHGIELHDNPWVCDCKMRSVKEWLSLSNVPYTVEPVCDKPERISGRLFGELTISDFACKPEILPLSRYVEAAAGENATISCRVGAVPSAEIHWYWNGRILLNNSALTAFQKIFIAEEGKFDKISVLTLTNALESDSGEFYCVAENKAGTTEANFTLNVSMRPRGIAALGSGEIAGLGAALLILLLAITMMVILFSLRLRRLPQTENKNSIQLEETLGTIQTSNGENFDSKQYKNQYGKQNLFNSSLSEDSVGGSNFRAPATTTTTTTIINNNNNSPDVILNTKPLPPLLPVYFNSLMVDCGSTLGNEQSRPAVCESRFPSNTWEFDSGSCESFLRSHGASTQQFHAPDRTRILDLRSKFGKNHDYPPDYGLPILESDVEQNVPQVIQRFPDEGTAGIFQQRRIPRPHSSAKIDGVFMKTRNSPDEGYQEGCGTDV